MAVSATKRVVVIGAGPAGLAAAEAAARAGRRVVVYDASPSPARKFLLAGRGGLNLTHSEPLTTFLARYGEAAPRLRPAIEAFPPAALRALGGGTRTRDLRRQQRPRIPEKFQGDAAAARLAEAARQPRRHAPLPLALHRLRRRRRARASSRQSATKPSRRPRRCSPSAARRGRGSARTADGSRRSATRRRGRAPETRELRIPRRLVAGGAGPLRRVAAQERRAEPWRDPRARRGARHRNRPRGRRRLWPVGRLARIDRDQRRRDARH